jgi:hypothetical protein
MIAHHTHIKKEQNTLKSDLLKETRMTYPHLCLALRNMILNEVSKDVNSDFLKLPQVVSAIKRKIAFYSIDRKVVYDIVAGVDAGSQRVPLASRWFAIIAALVYQLPNAKRYFTKPEAIRLPYSFSDEKFHEIVSLRRETKLFETATRFVTKNKVDLVLIDGPLAFGNWWANKGEKQDRQALISSINLLLKLCAKEGIAIAGIVKRTTARYLINYLELQQITHLPDSFVLLQMLKPGERTDVFSPRDALQRMVRAAPFMDLINHTIYSFYTRLSSNHLLPPIRIDIPEFMLDSLDNLTSYCYSTAINKGIPLPIVKADEEVRVTKKFVYEIYSELIPRLEKRFGTSSMAASVWGEFK